MVNRFPHSPQSQGVCAAGNDSIGLRDTKWDCGGSSVSIPRQLLALNWSSRAEYQPQPPIWALSGRSSPSLRCKPSAGGDSPARPSPRPRTPAIRRLVVSPVEPSTCPLGGKTEESAFALPCRGQGAGVDHRRAIAVLLGGRPHPLRRRTGQSTRPATTGTPETQTSVANVMARATGRRRAAHRGPLKMLRSSALRQGRRLPVTSSARRSRLRRSASSA